MHSKFISLHLDFLGFSASMLCAVHCLALPFILTFGTLSGLSWMENHAIEISFLLVSLLLASLSLVQAYRKRHGRLTAIYVVLLGFLIIMASRFLGGNAHVILAGIGGSIVAAAHIINWRLLQCKA